MIRAKAFLEGKRICVKAQRCDMASHVQRFKVQELWGTQSVSRQVVGDSISEVNRSQIIKFIIKWFWNLLSWNQQKFISMKDTWSAMGF